MLAFGAAVAQERDPPGQQRRDAAATPANTPNFSSRHRYARGLKTTVRILPPLRGSVMIIVLSVGYASLTHGFYEDCKRGYEFSLTFVHFDFIFAMS